LLVVNLFIRTTDDMENLMVWSNRGNIIY